MQSRVSWDRLLLAVVGGLGGVVGIAGCGSQPSATPLTPESFYREQTPSADVTVSPVDRANPVAEDPGIRRDGAVLPPLTPIPKDAPPAPIAAEIIDDIPEYVRASVPAMSGTTAPTSAPTTAETKADASLQPGGFQVVGFIMAEVNGHPIYADDVIDQLRSALAAEARKLEPDAFRPVARKLIDDKVRELVLNELEVAAADNGMNVDDRKLADVLTTQWRSAEITKAGGSAEQAREKYRSQGLDFEQQVREQYRANLVRVFYRKKIVPLIHVGADDIRDYYRRNANLYTKEGTATFRIIKVDPKAHDGRDAAERLASELRAKATDSDFTALASSESNDDKSARARGGLVEGMKKGSFVLEKLEAAVWETPVGQLTPVVSERGAFYIAKVESKIDGAVQAFDDVKVQEEIRSRLSGEQFQKFRSDLRKKLVDNAVAREATDAELAVAVDMAMQSYDAWSRADE